VLDDDNWDSVHKILTVGTPNLGVDVSVGIVGQLRDLKTDSEFVTNLNDSWQERTDTTEGKKWGVVGAIDLDSAFTDLDIEATDSGGPGFVKLKSAIPYETEAALEEFGRETVETPHFGFRIAVKEDHIGLLFAEGTLKGIHWAIRENSKDI
jgi:hypothetical protein